MISNTATFKLKALKSSRDIDEDFLVGDALECTSSSTEIVIPNLTNSRDGKFKTNKLRHFEYRPTRGAPSDRRPSSYRGRGNAHHRGRDRDDSNAYPPRKFQEPLNKNPNDTVLSYHQSKYYETDLSYGLPEDTRISKLLRRLNLETDPDKSLGISKKLLEVLLIPDNSRYVRRAFHILSASVLEILHVAPGPAAKRQVACALGRIGYVMEADFRKFQEWLFQKFASENDEIKVLFMKAVKETLKFEKSAPKLQEFSVSLMGELQTSIEITENPDVFTATLENLIALIEIYPKDFYSQFSNTVDILFGWHVDHAQPMRVIEFVSRSLQRLSSHFRVNLEFSITLIKHFLEDMDDYIQQLRKRRCADGRATTAKEHVLEGDLEPIIMSILAVNTVLKCLGESFSPANSDLVTSAFVSDCLSQIVKTAADSLENYVPDNLIIAANDSVTLLLTVLGTKSGQISDSVYALIDLELSLTQEFSDATIVSMLAMVSTVIKSLSANLPIDLVPKLVGPSSELLKLRTSNVGAIQNAVVVVYQSLLNLKNIPLLQEAYRCVLGDLEFVYKNIVPDTDNLCPNNPFDECKCHPDDAEATALLLLRCLSLLANASSSIIGMWALKPSILELLAVNLKPYDANLSKTAPSLQYGLIYLLYSHCKCYNHFVSSSSLVTNLQTSVIGRLGLPDSVHLDEVTKSPSSGNLVIILSVLSKCLSADTTCETKLLLLQWFEEVFVHAEPYMEMLYATKEFARMAEALFAAGYAYDKRIVTSVSVSLERLLSNKQLSWNNAFLTSVCDLCKLHVNSNDADIRKRYVSLSINIPWDICVIDMNRVYSVHEAAKKCTDIGAYNNWSVVLAQHLQLNGAVFGEILPQQFKVLMGFLLRNEEPPEANWLENIFTCCWPLDSELQANSEDFRELALASRTVLHSWAVWESAQLCVNSKLRTPLGKPMDTFTSFESALKDLLRDVSKGGGAAVKQGRVRLLLDFMECLEKSIYNAGEGCAFAMQPPLKPVKTFFHTNTSTCQEWLNRIRSMVIHLALLSGYSTLALRHGQAFLQHLVNANKAKTPDFDKVLMLVSMAMLNLKESEALQGLYVWSQQVAAKPMPWIKCAIDQASKKYESAAEKYQRVLKESVAGEAKVEEEPEKAEATDAADVNDLSSIEVAIKRFMSDQVISCYKSLNNWKAVVEWKKQEKDFVPAECENRSKNLFASVEATTAKALADIEANNWMMNDLMSWGDAAEGGVKDDAGSWSAYQITKDIEQNLYEVSLNVSAADQSNVSREIERILDAIQCTIQDNLRSLPSEFLQDYTVLHYAAFGLKNIVNNASAVPVFLVSEEFETEIKKMDSCLLSKILWWFEYFSKLQDEGSSTFFSNLRLDIIKKARKEGNLHLASTHLHKYLRQKELIFSSDRPGAPDKNGVYKDFFGESGSNTGFLENVAEGLINPSSKFDVGIWTYDNSRAVIEAAKLLYAFQDNKDLVLNLCATASTGIMQHLELSASAELQQTSCKILLTLAKWIQQESDHELLSNLNTSLGRLVMILPDIGLVENRGTSLIPLPDMAVGKLLKLSLHQCATSGKAWSCFGAWCYRWGRKIVDQNSAAGGQLSLEDKNEVEKLLPPETAAEDVQKVHEILSQTRANAEEEDIELNDINTSEMIEAQLLEVPVLARAFPEQLTALVDIWRQAQKRIYSYYDLSAEAYFKYLHLSGTSGAECTTITATLRLLRLIVKHALELQNVLETGLANTPTHPWKVIIPQLFSRLNHPEAYVRRRVSELLCRVAEDAPHLITFPAVVGAVDGGLGLKFELPEIAMSKDCFSQAGEGDAEEDLAEAQGDQSKDVLHSCFMSMVETLSKQAPETIAQVQLLVKELRRITLLWDELWLGTLLQHHGEISKRLVQLELEVEKVNANANLTGEEKTKLISEKHRIIIKPIVFILEQLHGMTAVEPETPHEKMFQERYLATIEDVLDKLRNPANPGKPQESWQPLKVGAFIDS